MAKTTFDFEYKTIIKKTETGFDIIGFNSPYKPHMDDQAQDDIRFALEQEKVVSLEDLQLEEKKELSFKIRFIENEDGTYNQICLKE